MDKWFCFYGRDVSLFSDSIRYYSFALRQDLSDDESDVRTECWLGDLEELRSSGFVDDAFIFPYDYVYVVLDALRYYDSLCCNEIKDKSTVGYTLGYYDIHNCLITLIAQINLMLDLNDDD